MKAINKILVLLILLTLPKISNGVDTYNCNNYLVLATCNSSTTYTVYGSATNATSFTEKCYTVYNTSANGNIVGYRKYITAVTCDTTNGYAADPTDVSVCIGNSTNTTTITVYSCACSDYYVWSGWSNYSTSYQRDTGTKKNCGNTTTEYRYRCKSGYYSAAGKSIATSTSDLLCSACPNNATCTENGATTFVCNIGYYQDGTGCTSCATTCGAGHTTTAAGATAYSQCKAPAESEITDTSGTFVYSTACCCDDSCDAKCSSGQACDSNSDCDSGLCSLGCCYNAKLCGTKGTSCTTDTDCPLLTPTCVDGCCTGSATLSCAKTSEKYCTSSTDCGTLQKCNLTTHCCEDSLIQL